jgi:hypothetical protein
MPAVTCPECDARVSCPVGTWADTEVTCPSCCHTFLTPESGDFPPKPDRLGVLGGRSDYVDAEAFTAPDPVVKKPRQPKLVVSGPVTVAFILGAVGLASLAGGTLVYTALKVQGRIAGDARPGGNPLGPGPQWAEPVRPDPGPAEPVAAPIPVPGGDEPRTPIRPRPRPAGAEVAPDGGAARPGTGDEAWQMLLGTWKLVEKPPLDPQDEPSLQKLTFGPDKSAVLTDNLFEHSQGKSPNYDDPYTVTAVKATAAGVTLGLRQKATGDDETLALTFDGRDRITVQIKPREAGPVYLFKFARN